MYDLLIIGSGPAGITAGIYAKRANLKVAVLEKGAPGGQVLNTAEVENYPGFKKVSGYEVASKMFEHLLELGAEVIFEEAVKINDLKTHKEIVTPSRVIETKTVLIATGAIPKTLGVTGEENFTYNGISWCAICDGPLYREKNVVVVGGGNSAIEEAIYLASIATHVTIIHRGQTLAADQKVINILLSKENVTVYYESNILEFIGDFNLKGVQVNHNGESLFVPCDGVFEYIGLAPVTSFANHLDITNELGYIFANPMMETKVPGLFAAGDVIVKDVRQIVTAVNDGAIAVQSILKYLE